MRQSGFEFEFFQRFLLSRRAGALVRSIAWISMTGIAVGVFALITVVSVMHGFHDSIRARLLAAEPHLVLRGADLPQLERADLESALAEFSAKAYPVEWQDVVIRTADGVFSGAEAKGLSREAIESLMESVSEAAHRESVDVPELGKGRVLLGVDLARGMGVFEGDKVTVISPEALLLPEGEAPRFERVTVDRLVMTNVADVDAKLFVYEPGQSLLGLSGEAASLSRGWEIWLQRPGLAPEAQAKLLNKWPELKGQTHWVQTWGERNSTLFQALRLEIFAIGLFLGLSTLIAGFSIVTVLLILITHKTKEIGLLMALGLSRSEVRSLFTRIGLLLTGCGVGAGSILGVAFCFWLDSRKSSILPDFYYDTTIPAHVDPLFVTLVVTLALGLGFFASWFPSRRVTDLMPAEAMRKMPQLSRVSP
ncbi:MAG TPA: ABC transporter permease [Pseudobdellovibrionaceae bacterium]|nr:ABC transporter permease [Pseudobdellovibrionaceae bacterium]